MQFADLVSMQDALLDAGVAIHDVNPSQLSGASQRCRCEEHYWMRIALQETDRLPANLICFNCSNYNA